MNDENIIKKQEDDKYLFTEEEISKIIIKHDDKWFDLLHKTERKCMIIICILLGFIIAFFTFKEVMYYCFPPIKSQIIITDTQGNVQDIKQIEERGDN